MTIETFFEKFELFAEAPGAVGKMRELVLQLAVQGKLVDQNRSDGNAAQLLADISSERDTRAAKLRTPNEPASADSNGQAFQVPTNWSWTHLGNIAVQIQYGYTASADSSATEIRMLRITDIQNNRVDWPSVPGCQIESDEAEKYLLSQNDILIARTGGTIGKSFIVPDAPVKSVFASYLIRVTPPRAMEARYLKTFLESPLYWTQLRQMSAGTGQPNVNGQALGRLAIPLPPLAEQKRIVAKVEELMALCDRLEAQQQEREERSAALRRASLARFADAPTPANLPFLFHPSFAIAPADLRKSILTLAVQGKLVEPDPTEEPVDDLLAKMEKRRNELIEAKKIRKPRDLPPVAEDEPPFSVPGGWRWTRWGQICDWITYGFTRPMAHVEKGQPIVTAKNVQDGFMTFENAHRADATEFADLNPKDLPRKGDILITKDGTIGRAAIVDTDEPFCINQSVAVLWLESCLFYRPFMLMVIRSPFAQGPIWEAAEGMAIKHLSITDFGKMILPLPPLAEQRRIVAKVDQLMALVDELESQLAASRATAAKLLSSSPPNSPVELLLAANPIQS